MSRFLQYGCEKIIIGEQLCDYLYFSFFGADVSQFNKVNQTIFLYTHFKTVFNLIARLDKDFISINQLHSSLYKYA